MGGSSDLAIWLIARRFQIERAMAIRLGPAAPGAGAPETEALRRFRTFATSALRRGEASAPPLDGLRVNERRVIALLEAWVDSAVELAGDDASELRQAIDPLVVRFRTAIRTTRSGRRARGTPRAARRAVMAAIDRVADSFIAIDADSGRIVDANPAAGALLGVNRDALLGVDAMSFVPEPSRAGFWTELDAMSEGAEPRRFRSSLRDAAGSEVPVACSVTCFATRDRTLALILARPS